MHSTSHSPDKTKLSLSDIALELELANYTATVIVTSDTCSKGLRKDLSGDFVVNSLKSMKFQLVSKHIVPDEKELISRTVKHAAEQGNNILVITIGGTGLCPRDVTPEATSVLYDKNCLGISTALTLEGLKHSPHAALSRLTAGIYSQCLIVNFPGKTKACVESFGCLSRILGHALEQIMGDLIAVETTHKMQDLEHLVLDNTTTQLVSTSESGGIVKSLSSCIPAKADTLDTLIKPPTPPISPPPRGKKSSNLSSGLEADIKSDPSSSVPSSLSLPDLKPLKKDSPYPLIDYEKALNIIESFAYAVCQTEIPIDLDSNEIANSILGDILARDVHSEISLPPFPVSTMDGFVINIPKALKNVAKDLGIVEALLVESLEEFNRLQQDPEQCISFFCYQVNTGGRVPEQNFAVTPVEKTAKIAKNIVTFAKIEPNRYVRKTGSDLCEADSLKAGTVIGPVELSILLSMGCKKFEVIKRPIIGVLSTGDELVEFYKHDKNDKTKFIDTNGPLLSALFRGKGFPVVDIGIARDNPRDILLKIHTGLKDSDILIITGGASMGSKDHVKDVVEQIGGRIHFGRVNIKPGKPAAMASLMVGDKRRFIFCLPGNPVSAYITSLVLVLPFIEHGIANHTEFGEPLTMNAIGDLIDIEIFKVLDSGDDTYKFDGRLEFVRARLMKNSGESHLAIVSTRQQSSRLLSLSDFDCLILIDPSKKGSKFLVGQTYRALRLRN